MTAMSVLGWWQYTAYEEQQRDDARTNLSQPPVGLDEALRPDQEFPADATSRPVTVRGTYVEAEQFYVEAIEGSPKTYAVATPLETESGSAVIVVRGARDRPSAGVPDGRVLVEGVLSPSMPSASPLDENRITDGIRTPALLSEVSADLYAGYVVLTDSVPAEPLERVVPPVPELSRWAGIRNLLYAVQWWVFAGFVGFMWWRIGFPSQPADSGRERDRITSAP